MPINTTVTKCQDKGLAITLDPQSVKLMGIEATLPFSVAVRIRYENNALVWRVNVANGNENSSLYVPLRMDIDHDRSLNDFFAALIRIRGVDLATVTNLSFLHKTMSGRSPEAQEHIGYAFEAAQAKSLEGAYAEWVAHILANNLSFSAVIKVDVTDKAICCQLVLQTPSTWSSGAIWTGHFFGPRHPREWQVFEAVVGLTAA